MLIEADGPSHPWTPPPGTVHAPVEGLTFECDDLASSRRLIVRAVDALDGARVEEFDVQVTAGGDRRLPPASAPPDRAFWVPTDVDVRWQVQATGYEPAEGDARMFTAAGDDLVLEVVLRRAP
jgi:hypothetical protein